MRSPFPSARVPSRSQGLPRVNLADLKICFIAGCLGQGGAERQLYYILQSLRAMGAAPRVLSLTQGEYWEDKFRQLGVGVTWVGQSNTKLGRLAQIVALLRKDRPDIIQSQHFFANLYAVAAARLLGVREIGAIRSNAAAEIQANGAILGTGCLRAPRLLAVNSRQAIQNAVNLNVSASRLTYLPNIVDTQHFRPIAKPLHRFVRLVIVGRLVALKRIDLFLAAVARCRQQTGLPLQATVVGEGPETERLQQRAWELGLLPHSVEFLGAVSDVASVYRAADILVLTSEYEGTPNVVLEGMACGLPIVATRVGGVPEVVQDAETGYLVESGDVDAMTDRVCRLCRDPSLRTTFGRRGRQYILRQHAPGRLPGFLHSLYEAALL